MKPHVLACHRRIISVCVMVLAVLLLGVSLGSFAVFARIDETPTTPSDIGRAYVSLPDYGRVAYLDTAAHIYLGSLDVTTGGCYSPYQVVMSPDEAHVFVACSSSVAVIATATNTIIQNISLPSTAYDIAFVQGGDYALVSVRDYSAVAVIDTATFAVVDSIATSSPPERLVPHPYLDYAYVTTGYGGLEVLDTNTFASVQTISLTGYSYDVVVSPDGQRVFVSDSNYPGGLHVINANTNTVITTISAPSGMYNLAISPDGETVFGGTGYSGIHVFDVATLSYETTISGLGESYNPVMNCPGTELYVGGGYNNYVLIVDTSTYSVSNYISLGGYYGPRGIAICPDVVINGVLLTPSEQSNEGALGEMVVHELTLVNGSEFADSYDVTLGVLNWDSALSVSQVGPLQPGEMVTFTVSVTVPISADWYDSDSVTITASSMTSPSVYSDTAVATTRAYASPQLTVSPDNLSSTQLVNTLTTQNLTFSNGNGITGTFEFVTQRTNLAVAGSDSFQMTNILSSDPSLTTYQFTDIGDDYSLVTLQAYDAVIVSEYDYSISASEAAALRQYYESGHPVMLGMDDIDDLDPLARADLLLIFGLSGAMDGVFYPGTANQSHPIGNGITTLYSTDDGDNDRYVADEAVWVVQGNDSYYYVMAHDGMARTVVFGELLATWWNVGNSQLGRNAVEWIAAGNLLNSWLTTSPMSGTISTNGSTAVTVTFNSYALQPGLYTQNLRVSTNQPDQMQISLPISLTVEPTASMGWVEGTITDAHTGLPLEATIIAIGQPYTVTSDANTGTYQFWLEAGNYTLQVSADGYVTETQAVSIVAQQGTTQDFDLLLNVPVINVTHDDMAVAQDIGQTTTRALAIANDGPADLTFAISEQDTTPISLMLSAQRNGENVRLTDTLLNLSGVHILYDRSHGQPDLSYYSTLVMDLENAGASIDENLSSPVDASLLAGYDVLWVNCCGYAWLADELTAVANWLDNGGGVLVHGDYSDTTANLAALYGISYQYTDHFEGPSSNIFEHPISEGVSVVYVGHNSHYSLLPTDTVSEIVVRDAQLNEPHVVAHQDGQGKMVVLASPDFDDGYILNDDNQLLANNTMAWLAASSSVPWLSTAPVSGTVTGYGAEPVVVTYDATSVQPGVYTADLLIRSNDPTNARVTIPVTMTVSPAAGMGRVMGTVTDLWTADPLTATVQLVGVYTDTADPDYSIWADAGIHTLIASAEGYMTATYTVTILANGVVVQDIALEPAQPLLGDMPEELVITAVPDAIIPYNLTLTNAGPLPLDFSWHEIAPTLLAGRTPSDLSGKVIMYDRAHGQGDLANYSTLAAAINNAGGLLTVNFAYPITANLLNNVDVLWVDCCGYTNWTFAELQVVNNWLEAGGAVLVHSENYPASSDVAGIYNITYQCCQYSYGTTTDILPHPTTQGVSAIFLDYSYDALNYTAAAEVTVRDTNGYAQAVAQEQNGGKMVVIDSLLFNNYRIDQEDNMLFAMNVMNWLAAPSYSDVPWLAVSPNSGTVTGHSSQEMAVTVDTTGLGLGTYVATLALEHNDPTHESPLLLPVTLEVVEQAAAIALTPEVANGSGLPGESVTYSLTIENTGNGPDTFDISISGDWLATPSILTTTELLPGESQQFTVLVNVPASASIGSSDQTAVTATSQFDTAVTQTVMLTTTAISSTVRLYLPVILKP